MAATEALKTAIKYFIESGTDKRGETIEVLKTAIKDMYNEHKPVRELEEILKKTVSDMLDTGYPSEEIKLSVSNITQIFITTYGEAAIEARLIKPTK